MQNLKYVLTILYQKFFILLYSHVYMKLLEHVYPLLGYPPGACFRKELSETLSMLTLKWGKLWVFCFKMGGLSNPGKQGKSSPFLKER